MDVRFRAMRAISLQTSILVFFCAVSVCAGRPGDPIYLPNGLMITPDAAPHSSLMMLNPGMPGRRDLTMGQAVTTALSPDGSTLLALTSGYNKDGPQKYDEYIFVFDATVYPPLQKQALRVPNSFCGLTWNPDGNEFYVSGGVDDNIYIFSRTRQGAFGRTAAINLGHKKANGLFANLPAPLDADAAMPMVAGISVN